MLMNIIHVNVKKQEIIKYGANSLKTSFLMTNHQFWKTRFNRDFLLSNFV